jgi:hypothetical protein
MEKRTDGNTTKKKLTLAIRKFEKSPKFNKNQIDLHNSLIPNTVYIFDA